MPKREFTILSPLEFIEDVAEEAKTAKERIYMQAMEVEPGEITNTLLDLLRERTDLDRRLHVDYYSLLILDGVFTYLPLLSRKREKKRQERIQKRDAYFTTFKERGVKLMYTNPPSFLAKIFPVIGRNHMKIVIVDDKAWIGGINFHDENFKSIDSMVKLTDPAIVSKIVDLYLDIEERKILSDQKILINDHTSLIIDGGKVNRSRILDEAVRLIYQADSTVTVITPIIPDTRLQMALKQARRKGIKVEVITHPISEMGGIYKPVDFINKLLFTLTRTKVPIQYKNKKIHAKILLVDEKIVLMGSHNLTGRGVAIGTQELAIVSDDTYFTEQAISFFNRV